MATWPLRPGWTKPTGRVVLGSDNKPGADFPEKIGKWNCHFA
jgi:hypothetical protein